MASNSNTSALHRSTVRLWEFRCSSHRHFFNLVLYSDTQCANYMSKSISIQQNFLNGLYVAAGTSRHKLVHLTVYIQGDVPFCLLQLAFAWDFCFVLVWGMQQCFICSYLASFLRMLAVHWVNPWSLTVNFYGD